MEESRRHERNMHRGSRKRPKEKGSHTGLKCCTCMRGRESLRKHTIIRDKRCKRCSGCLRKIKKLVNQA